MPKIIFKLWTSVFNYELSAMNYELFSFPSLRTLSILFGHRFAQIITDLLIKYSTVEIKFLICVYLRSSVSLFISVTQFSQVNTDFIFNFFFIYLCVSVSICVPNFLYRISYYELSAMSHELWTLSYPLWTDNYSLKYSPP